MVGYLSFLVLFGLLLWGRVYAQCGFWLGYGFGLRFGVGLAGLFVM